MILLTGFEPFGGDTHNPSAAVAQALESDGVAVRILPVDGVRIQVALEKAIEETKPDALIMLGLARGKTRITLEKVAMNWLEYRIPDNSGMVQHGKPILEHAPDALFSSLPLEAIQLNLKEQLMPAELSFSAGTFLCNQVFFLARALYPQLPSGFVHLPSDETLALSKSEPFLPLKFQIKAAGLIIKTIQSLDS
jgi:pyroglutamyl-peptidase